MFTHRNYIYAYFDRVIDSDETDSNEEDIVEIEIDNNSIEKRGNPDQISEVELYDQLDFLGCLGLITSDKHTELQNKRAERKRRSTANPQFVYSNWEIPTVSLIHFENPEIPSPHFSKEICSKNFLEEKKTLVSSVQRVSATNASDNGSFERSVASPDEDRRWQTAQEFTSASKSFCKVTYSNSEVFHAAKHTEK